MVQGLGGNYESGEYEYINYYTCTPNGYNRDMQGHVWNYMLTVGKQGLTSTLVYRKTNVAYSADSYATRHVVCIPTSIFNSKYK